MMRLTDAVLSVPLYLALSVISDILLAYSRGGNSVLWVVLLIAAFAWPRVARVIRGEFLSLKEREYLLAARTLGARDWRLIILHILPNAIGANVVAATLTVGDAIIVESILSFFGFGVQPPTATWGTMLADSQSYFTSDPLLLYLPGLAVLATVLSVSLVGDGLRDAFDPYQTQRRCVADACRLGFRYDIMASPWDVVCGVVRCGAVWLAVGGGIVGNAAGGEQPQSVFSHG